jgi:hypothetical protein
MKVECQNMLHKIISNVILKVGFFIVFLLSISVLFSNFSFAQTTSSQKIVTQGEYAIELAERLGLGENLSMNKAISVLTEVGIVPEGGFNPNGWITLDFLHEIRSLVIAAADKGLIQFSAEQVVMIITEINNKLVKAVTFAPPIPVANPPSRSPMQ